jgi:hypothetical protein
MTQHQFLHTFSLHICLFYIYFVSFGALKPKRPHIFPYQSRPHTLKLDMTQQQFSPQAFLPITHTFTPHIYLFYIYVFSFWALHPKEPHIFFYQSRPALHPKGPHIFVYQSRAGPGDLDPRLKLKFYSWGFSQFLMPGG